MNSLALRADFEKVLVIGMAVGVLSQFIIQNLLESPSLLFRGGIFFFFLGLGPFALWVASLIGKVFPVLYQFAKFAAVGALNQAIDFGVLNFLIYSSGMASGWMYSVFKGISFFCSTTNSFFWNRSWTFASKNKISRTETLKFYFFAGGGWMINVSVASLVVNGFAAPAGLAPALWANVGAVAGVLASFLWNFLSYKYIVFRPQIIRDLTS